MEDKKVSRLILKENDILVLYVPKEYFTHRRTLLSIYTQIKDKLIAAGKRNKILMIPNDVKINVIGEEEIKEYVSNIDLWQLFDEEGEDDGRDI